ncbi:Centromere protein C [Dissostichus eleginoides]|uniref:Centromere protein C n=1 Tax=Dissostichus eleginoides TaxID=100907 RepID=A0AAD9BMS3_DISEL|nr:Centromere protein C [Dissostichus eleginoides]
MKRGKKVPQGSDGETGKASKKQGPSSEEVGATDLGGLSDKEIMNPEAQTDEDSADVKKDKNNKLPVVSEGSSPDDSLTLGRRRRRPPGEWWMHRSPEETTGKCNQPPRAQQQLSKNKAPQRKEPQRKEPQRKEPLSAVRRGRRPPGSWWAVQEVESVSPQQQKPKPRKKRIRSPPPPKESSSVPLLNPQSPVKRSRAASEDMFSLNETQGVGRGRRKRQKVRERPVEEIPPADCSVFSTPNAFIHHSSPQDEGPQRYSVDRSKHLGSGPSSMIVLQQFEEEDSLILPNSRVHAPLSLSDLCAPPLEPMTLLTKDKANLAEWFMNLWELPLKIDSTEIFPDQFEWFCYQGRAIGFTMDVNSGSFCNGKMLLGSFMKKPLWVDHSAATVFNLLTSSVSVTINGRESCFNPGKSFMVPCGSAYSLQNVCAQPAVLYFTRIISESSE